MNPRREKLKEHRGEAPPSSPRRGALKPLLAAAAALLAAGAFAWTDFIWVLSVHNGRIPFTSYPLLEESWDHPRLRELRRREKLDEVVAPGKTQLEKLILLRHWAHEQWSAGDGHFYYPAWDALEILDLARRYGNHAFCAQYAIVYLQALRSLGLHGRYVNLPGHFTVEVWSDELNRWLLMDPTFDFYFERKGKILTGKYLSKAVGRGDIRGIEKVGYDGTRSPVTMEEVGGYKDYEILLRSNQLSKPELIRDNGVERRLVLEKDYRRYPYIGRDSFGFGDGFLLWKTLWSEDPKPGTKKSDDPDDFRDYFNQTLILVASKDPAHARLKLKLHAENAPNLEGFSVTSDAGLPMRTGDLVIWPLHGGLNSVAIAAETAGGWRGQEASMTVLYKPNWLSWLKRG